MQNRFLKSISALFLSVILVAAAAESSFGQSIALDPAFGISGTVRSSLGCGGGIADVGNTVLLQSDGKIVVIGDSYSSGRYAGAVARFNSDGSVDNTFRSIGSVRTSISSNYYDEHTFGGLIQSDGKIVVVSSYDYNGNSICLVRYNSNGNKDNSFGSSGIAWNSISGNGFLKAFSGYGGSVAVQTDGKIIVAGRSKNSSGYYQFALTRFLPDGTLDATFGSSGTVRNFISGGTNYDDEANSVAIQSDGKIVAGGISYGGTSSNLRAFAVARYNSDGSLDSDFGSGGTARNNIDGGDGTRDEAYGVAIQGDGKILLVGKSFGTGSGGMAIARYTTTGALDNSFGTAGTVRQIISSATYPYDCGWRVGVLPDGKIVVAGNSQLSASPSSVAIVGALFGPDGSFCCSSTDFITGGNGSYDQAYSLAFQSDGKLLVAGSSAGSSNTAFAIARYVINDIPLAAGVVSSSAVADERGITLLWKTASEINNAGFRILRLAPGITIFSLIASYLSNDALKGLGTSANGRRYSFTDSKVKPGGNYSYEIQSVSTNGTTKDLLTLTGIIADVPKDCALYQNYPNPANPSTTIKYQLAKDGLVTLKVCDPVGREVKTLVNEVQPAGNYMIVLDASGLSSGVYFYRLEAGEYHDTRKLLLLK